MVTTRFEYKTTAQQCRSNLEYKSAIESLLIIVVNIVKIRSVCGCKGCMRKPTMILSLLNPAIRKERIQSAYSQAQGRRDGKLPESP
jgi:hypothetical protein